MKLNAANDNRSVERWAVVDQRYEKIKDEKGLETSFFLG